MLSHLSQHRWICFVQGGLTLALGLWLLYLRQFFSGNVSGMLGAPAALLATGFVLLASGLLDLAVALEVTAHAISPLISGIRRAFSNSFNRHPLSNKVADPDSAALRAAAIWWLMGGIALAVGCVVLNSPTLSLHLLAGLAAIHAVTVAAMDVSYLPNLETHKAARLVCISSSIFYLLCSFALTTSAFASDDRAILTLGAYAAYFGLRMVFLGHHLRSDHHPWFAVSS